MNDINIINLSGRVFSDAETSLLSRGITYCPTANFRYAHTRVDLFHFTRKLKLKYWYLTKPGRCRATSDTHGFQADGLMIEDMFLLRDIAELDT